MKARVPLSAETRKRIEQEVALRMAEAQRELDERTEEIRKKVFLHAGTDSCVCPDPNSMHPLFSVRVPTSTMTVTTIHSFHLPSCLK